MKKYSTIDQAGFPVVRKPLRVDHFFMRFRSRVTMSFFRDSFEVNFCPILKTITPLESSYKKLNADGFFLRESNKKWTRSGQSVTASDFGSNGPRFESGRGRCVESLDKALYSHCPKEKPSH